MGERMLCPRIARHDRERTLGMRLRSGELVAQLVGEAGHGEKVGILRMRGFEPGHVRAKAWTHVLLAEDVIEELGELRGQQIARPLGGDRFHGLDGAQIVVGEPERERLVQRALARIRRQRRAGCEVRPRGRACAVGLAVEPERRRTKLQDRYVRPAPDRIEDGLDALIEAEQPRAEVVRRRDRADIIRRDLETARVLHLGSIRCRWCPAMVLAR